MGKSKSHSVKLVQSHPCGAPVLVPGLGQFNPGEFIEVAPDQAERLLAGKAWSIVPDNQKPAKTS